ncbi:hypothetical protein TanjilG_09816 [Lupinus angustifolius]|uniref:Transcription initiation factor TFIID subunit 8 n=1 Tax=Lupinus angustifolius TaxID=3871 RepID=A0A4P1QWY2_LUPAN|nr:PREDICTED: transcription initiation factor TFIID subunit 8-like [Lupinus angustifolius]OIV96389.1 hypothetical protein TanjilG_09816 [Lupinus angustifolius]
MSHGGTPSTSDDFGRAVSNLAVAQLCDSAGFDAVNTSALDAFADVTIRYLLDLGKTTQFYANLSGRSQCTVFDLILGLQDLESPLGFPSQQQQQQCLVSSGIVSEVINYVNLVDNEIPFENPIPRFPIVRNRKNIPSFSQFGETPPSKHIPNWLPALPDPHTYIHTPVWNERVSDPREDKIEQARQRRKAERSLLSLQKRLLSCSNGSVESSSIAATADDDDSKGQGHEVVVDKNSTQGNNKEASPVVALVCKLSDEAVDGKGVSVLEAFAPAFEGLKGDILCDDGQEEKIDLPAVRPTVHFKFKIGKKFIGESLDTRHRNKGALRTAALGGREDERDDKKRRAEYILKQSMENTQELTLL